MNTTLSGGKLEQLKGTWHKSHLQRETSALMKGRWLPVLLLPWGRMHICALQHTPLFPNARWTLEGWEQRNPGRDKHTVLPLPVSWEITKSCKIEGEAVPSHKDQQVCVCSRQKLTTILALQNAPCCNGTCSLQLLILFTVLFLCWSSRWEETATEELALHSKASFPEHFACSVCDQAKTRSQLIL